MVEKKLENLPPKKLSEESNGKQVFAVISELVQLVIILALVGVSVLSFGSRVPALSQLGFRFFTVISGSMEPGIPTGSLLLAGSYQINELKAGDIITYQKVINDQQQPAIVTHRVDKITKTERIQELTNSETNEVTAQTIDVYEIITKGDANQEVDSYLVYPGEILGIYQWHVPKVGYLVNFIQSRRGFLMVVVIPAMVLIIWESVSLVLSVRSWLDERKQRSRGESE